MELYLTAEGRAVGLPAAEQAREAALGWFDELHAPLRRYLLCVGASPADADEAVQESFLRLYQKLEKGGGPVNVRAWVFEVARNLLRDERKSARHQRTVPLDEAMDREGGGPGPEQSVLSEERARRLGEAVRRLPPQQRECVLLRASGLRHREIAEVLGIQTCSVGALMRRALARLNEEMA